MKITFVKLKALIIILTAMWYKILSLWVDYGDKMWILAAAFSIDRNRHLILHWNDSNIIIIANSILGQLIDFFNSKSLAKISLEYLLINLALMILGA